MFKTLRNAWAIPDLRHKMLYTLLMIFIFRLGSFIPVPGLREGALESLLGDGNNLFAMLDTFSGGAFANATIFAMGITPYINSSIILQLLTVAIPALERLSKEGEEGRRVIAKWTRFGTVILAFIQATGLYFAIKSFISIPGVWGYITIVTTFTAGTAFLMWLGEQITEKGIGNGISIIIFAGIVSDMPSMISQIAKNFSAGSLNIWGVLAIALISLVMVTFVVFMDNAERRIPVQYAKRMVGRKMYGGQNTHIPIKVVMAGVIPIIFAMSIMSFPSTIMGFMGYTPGNSTFWGKFWSLFTQTSWVYMILYFLLIVFFTYFYTAIQFNPVEIANNMKRNGGFVPGIRPGRPTSDYIAKILTRITLAGALFLGIVAVLPMILSTAINYNFYAIGGSSLLIVVGVALETTKQIESQMLMRHYKGFLE
ncbi:MAG: preprotein translocase subunit SecY [Clostridia bacterium]|nr:preprotein translocase subunit SecY [Clostridia bacterium]